MISAPVALIVMTASVVASSIALLGQQDPGAPLTIRVTDMTGAPIPEASIKIMSPEDGRLLAFTADSRGIADLQLKSGEYQYRIASPGFCPKNGTATVDAPWSQEMRAALQVDACPGPCAPPCVTPIGVEPAGYPVMVKVTDTTEAVVPGALIQISPSVASFKPARTDARGRALIGLPNGMYSLTVIAPGFRKWKGFAEVHGTEEFITARLRIAGTVEPEITIEPPGVDLPLYVRPLEMIALQPLETLSLPGVALRGHNHRH